MKKSLGIFLIGLFVFTGCSNTWNGVKKDSSNAWEKTKEVSSDAYDATKKSINKMTE